ncbi:MAG: hypothetical protein AAFN38_07940, partial [Cyanobacteria bacterium J06560_5]
KRFFGAWLAHLEPKEGLLELKEGLRESLTTAADLSSACAIKIPTGGYFSRVGFARFDKGNVLPAALIVTMSLRY